MAALVVFSASCGDDENAAPPAISTDEAADMIGQALSANGGLLSIANQSAIYAGVAVEAVAGGRQAACEFSDDETISVSSQPGTSPTFGFSITYAFSLVCDGEEASSLSVDVEYELAYDGPEVAFAFNGSSALSVSGLQEAAPSYIINGDLDRNGTFQWKEENGSVGTAFVEVQYDELIVTKTYPHVITDGTATVNLSGSVTGKGSFSYSATVDFNNDGTANVTVGGVAYKVDLVSGSATRG